jgi:hypothetical protein
MEDQSYLLPELPYDPAGLEPHISGRIIELHYFKHHAAYVKGANATVDRLRDHRSRRDFTMMAALEKNLAFHVSGHVLHSLLWSNMSPHGGGTPSGALANELERTFGSANVFRRQMVQAAGTIGVRVGLSRRGSPSAVASSCNRCTTTRATMGRARSRSSQSMPGNTRITSSSRTARPSSSKLSGTSSTGTTSRAATSSRVPRS